jgi:ATP-binding cassette subfamily C (CFTR/MRP) protein 1
MMFLPRALSATSDARNALSRLRKILTADLRNENALNIDDDLKWALEVKDATFVWEESSQTPASGAKAKNSSVAATVPFSVEDITMHVQRGSLVAIVGRVGSGKSSLLLGLINEMRSTTGSVVFGGRVAYCPQTAWIQNVSLVRDIISPYRAPVY